jgi:beta-xylosidase
MRRLSVHLAACFILVGLLVLLAACGAETATSTRQAATTTTQAVATTAAVANTTAATTTGVATTSAATTAASTTAAVTTSAATTAAVTTVAATSAPATTTSATTAAASVTTSAATTAVTGTTAAAGAATPGPNQFVNPVINSDFPDPDILKVNDTYYAYATNTASKNVQVARSTDLVHWQMLSDALPTLPGWSEKGNTWAPDVTATADGKSYVMYFVARHTASNKQCIGVATSASPEGPFTSSQPNPIICQLDQGGSIDPNTFFDSDGTRYLVWKNDGNCCSIDTFIYLQKVSADGLSLTGQPSKLIQEDQPWEGNLVEAPAMFKHGNKYYLFYSANNYAGADYAIGYATADSLTGKFQKPGGDEPFVKTAPADNGKPPVIGPGGEDVVVAKDGTIWMVYHSWDPTVSYRQMNIDELTWDGDKPVFHGPSVTPESIP